MVHPALAQTSVLQPLRYQRHRPDKSDLHRIIRENLDVFTPEDPDLKPPPAFVRKAFEEYINCGLLCRGFVRFACELCRTNVFVAFSCKGPLCPSCGARRMEDTTEHIMTRVLPDMPVRQWVLSMPFQLRPRVAFDADLFSTVVRIFVDEVFRHHARKARSLGLGDPTSGAIAVLQRFGSTLNATPHVHVVALDGVHVRAPAGDPSQQQHGPAASERDPSEPAEPQLIFHAFGPPTPVEVHAVSKATCRRVLRLLRSRGIADAEGLIPLESPDAIQVVGETAARQWPLFAQVDADARVHPVYARSDWARAGDFRGFSTDASVSARPGDTEGRRRIIRYCVRPPFAQRQVRATADGRVAFELRHPRNNGATHVVFSEHAFVKRLMALVPKPYHHSIRYFGCLAPASPLRSAVVPTPPIELHLHGKSTSTAAPSAEPSSIPGAKRRAAWAFLLRRVYDLDALACPKPGCPGRLRPIAAITHAATVRKILEHTGLDDEPPPPRPRPGPPLPLFAD